MKMVGPGGMPRQSNFNNLPLQTSASVRIEPKGTFGAVTNRMVTAPKSWGHTEQIITDSADIKHIPQNRPCEAMATQTLGVRSLEIYDAINKCYDSDQLDETLRLLWKGYVAGSIGEGEGEYERCARPGKTGNIGSDRTPAAYLRACCSRPHFLMKALAASTAFTELGNGCSLTKVWCSPSSNSRSMIPPAPLYLVANCRVWSTAKLPSAFSRELQLDRLLGESDGRLLRF